METKLTSEQIASLNDRELDALVVETITHESTCPWNGAFPSDDVPLYSSNTTMVGELVSRWRLDNPELAMEVLSYKEDLGDKYKGVIYNAHTKKLIAYAVSYNIHRAICIALILAEQEK